MTFSLLSGVRIVDLSVDIAGPYATKLLVDAGADVVKLEPPGGDPLRSWTASGTELHGSDGALFQFLNAGKRISRLDLPSGALDALLDTADAVLESGQLSLEEIDRIRANRPALVIASISPYGRRGPWAGRPATEFILQAECGAMSSRGLPEREPLQVGGRFGEWVTGVGAAVALLSAVFGSRRSGRGDHVDVSMFEAMCAVIGGRQPLSGTLGGVKRSGPARSVEMPSVEPTADGYVGICTNTGQQFRDFLAMIGRSDLIEDGNLATFAGRWSRREEFWDIVRSWTREHTTAEIVELANLMRIPTAPVGRPDELMNFDHIAERGIFGLAQSGGARVPRVPYQVNGREARPEAPPLEVDTETLDVASDRRGAPRHPKAGDPRLPFTGLRILDFTSFWAGPMSTKVFASLGADVIHLESVQHPDGNRFITMRTTDLPEEWWERSVGFQQENVNKRGVTLNLGDPRGRELMLQLVEHVDAVVENYAPRVLDSFGITPEIVRERNPRAIMLRMPAFGLTGPWRDRNGFASTMEAATGLAWITGYRDGHPVVLRGPLDPVSGMHAAFALAAALFEREETGAVHFLEAPMIEVALNVAAELTIEYTAYGAVLGRDGNRGPFAAPQGAYRCRGEDCWLALAVADDEQWMGLRKALGNPDWASAPELESTAGRRRDHDLIDEHLSDWAADLPLDDAVDLLLRHGVAAGRVVDGLFLLSNEQLQARGYYQPVDNAVLGRHQISSHPFRFASVTDGWIRRPAPRLGEHTREILTELLGLTTEHLDELEADAVIGTRPLGL